ncbi:MAG: PKD domain-containing protein [Bacteroidales bacterium]|jgi:PKD repeat protein|nr:PKD domain-containing protein [Bacteroidales bacterium]
MKKNIILLIICLLSVVLHAQKDIDDLFKNTPELTFKFELQNRDKLNELNRHISLDRIENNMVFAYADRIGFEYFINQNIAYEIVEKPAFSEEYLNMTTAEMFKNNRNDWNSYPTYEAYVEMMYQFESDYPELCEVINFGTTVQNRQLLVCKISKNVEVREPEPQVFWSSTMHGDETTGYVLMLRLIDYLLQYYGVDDQVTHLLDNTEIWINPLANPDGTYRTGNSSVSGSTRSNANNVDLNRNYKDWKSGDHPDGKVWQPETIAFMELQAAQNFVLAVNIHGGAEVCNYPWDNTTTKHADDDWWIFACREYADTAQYYSPSGYMTYMDNGITRGSAWYQIDGGRQDYANYYDHCREFCLEISNTKLPAASQLPNFWNYNYRSFLNYTQQALYGIHGIVTDKITQEPLPAKILIYNHDKDNSFVLTDERSGHYARPIKTGTYTVITSSEGYFPDTTTISVSDRNQFIHNVELYKGEAPIPDFESDITLVQLNNSVSFTDLSVFYPNTWEWHFEGGTPATSNEQNPVITYKEEGDFNVALIVSNEFGEKTITKEAFIKARKDPKPPIADFEADQTIVPTSTTITFSDLSQNEPTAWEWHFEGGTPETSSEQNPVVLYEIPGKYDVSLTVHNNDASDMAIKEKYIVVQESTLYPVANFEAQNRNIYIGETVSFTNLSHNADRWEWSFEGGTPDISHEEHPVVTYNNVGTFSVSLKVYNDYGDDEEIKESYISVPQSIVHIEDKDVISIYPNPVARGETATVRSEAIISRMEIFNILGQNVKTIETEINEFLISETHFQSGIYIVRVTTSEGIRRTVKLQIR